MYTPYFVAAILTFVSVIAVQLVKLNSNILRSKKNEELLKKRIKEDNDWEFIKGLY